MAKVKLGFSGLGASDQLFRARYILKRMKGNAHFPFPNPSLLVLEAAVKSFGDAWRDSRNGNRIIVATMRLRRKEVLALFRTLAAYVQVTSGGDPLIILSSGFDIITRGSGPRMKKVVNLRTQTIKRRGCFRAIWDTVTGAEAYDVWISETGKPGSWRHYRISLTTRFTFTRLEPGQVYWISVCAVGRKGYGAYSSPVRGIARY